MYLQPIDRINPGCILFLLDQSLSMEDTFAGSDHSKSDELANAVNRLLRNLVLQCQRGPQVRNYYQIGVIGYGNTVGTVLSGELAGQYLVPIDVLAGFPLRMATEHVPGSPDISVQWPEWIQPLANGPTPMISGIDLAGSVLVDWANQHIDSFPPIVINISDGQATDGDPRPLARQLRDIRTNDGNLLFFNVNLTSGIEPAVEYPISSESLSGDYARGLFEMSSELTPYMLAAARNLGLDVRNGSRGFVFNADMGRLNEFLNIGTQTSRVPDR